MWCLSVYGRGTQSRGLGGVFEASKRSLRVLGSSWQWVVSQASICQPMKYVYYALYITNASCSLSQGSPVLTLHHPS